MAHCIIMLRVTIISSLLFLSDYFFFCLFSFTFVCLVFPLVFHLIRTVEHEQQKSDGRNSVNKPKCHDHDVCFHIREIYTHILGKEKIVRRVRVRVSTSILECVCVQQRPTESERWNVKEHK